MATKSWLAGISGVCIGVLVLACGPGGSGQSAGAGSAAGPQGSVSGSATTFAANSAEPVAPAGWAAASRRAATTVSRIPGNGRLGTGAVEPTPLEGQREPDTRHVERTGPARGGGTGRLRVSYQAAADSDLDELGRILKGERFMETVVEDLDQTLVLPRDVAVVLGECGEVNAFYDSEERQIILCYEMLAHFLGVFASEAETEAEFEEAGVKAASALVFIFYHELGHALVDLLDLPIVGREEDAVDQLATVMLLETWEGEESEMALLATAEAFGVDSGDVELATWDEHSLDEQRYYNVLCWTYGSDPDYFSPLTEDGWGLPVERAERCSEEYELMSRAWDRLLGPHLAG